MYKRLTNKNKTTNDNHVFVFHSNGSQESSTYGGRDGVNTGSARNIILRPPRVFEHPNSMKRQKKKVKFDEKIGTDEGSEQPKPQPPGSGSADSDSAQADEPERAQLATLTTLGRN